MSEKVSIDQAVGKELGLPPDIIKSARLAWNDNAQMKGVFVHRLNGLIRERQQALETIEPSKLEAKQAEIKVLKNAIAVITEHQT